MKIAICDDEKIIRENIKSQLVQYFNEHNIVCGIDDYEDFRSFDTVSRDYDLVFLDYSIPGDMTGIEYAKKLRGKNEKIFIVFLTSFPEHVFESFSLNTFRYLVKPISGETLTEVVGSFVTLYQTDRKILVPTPEKTYCFDADEVMYIEADRKYTVVRTTGLSIRSNKGISAFEAEINNPRFFRTHRSFILNMKYVSSYDKKDITLTNGEIVMISPKRYDEFVKNYFNYLKYRT